MDTRVRTISVGPGAGAAFRPPASDDGDILDAYSAAVSGVAERVSPSVVKPVAGIDNLHRLLTEERAGARVALNVLRDGASVELPVVPEELP